MPEILTESFCERCGTRYTFESVAPRKTRRLGQFKTLSRGVKNWVMSDDSSLDEAMAAARSDQDREVTTQQLDAFHATFNFCMNCRQYTCSNCWNPAEGRCLTCAPNFAGDVLQAPFPDATQFEPVRIDADAWPEMDLPGVLGANAADLGAPAMNGAAHAHDHENGFAATDEGVAPETTRDVDEMPDFDAAARLAFLAGDDEPVAASAANVEPADAEPVDVGRADVEPDAAVVDAPSPEVVDLVPLGTADDEAVAATAAGSDVAGDVPPLPDDVDGRAAVGAARTAELLARFRPGQNIDAELAAYEAELESAAAGTDDESKVAGAPEGEIAAALAAADVVPEPVEIAPDVAAAETEVAAQPEESPIAAAQQTEEPVAPESAATAPVEEARPPEPARPRDDRIEQPTWRIFAPEPAPVEPTIVPPAAPPGAAPTRPTGEPQWPARPEFTESPSMALLAKRTSSDELWAASAREVLAGPTGPAAAAPAGIQPCSNCGLSLSATARFCRRCGTRQA